MQDPTETIGNAVRIIMTRVARFLNKATDGAIKPAHITLLSLLGHIPAAWALWTGRPLFAAIYIAVFGLMDSLDGALAREQKSASKMGMFFDAVTDRLKETLLYSALAVFVANDSSYAKDVGVWAVPAVAATSLLVSYVKAKGEMAVSTNAHDRQLLNRAFSQGIARYEIRMTLLIIGLISGLLAPLLNLIIALNLITASLRFMEVARLLNVEDAAARATVTIKKKTIM
jgi:CDP-diacylglycerol--glycerol-3-phosphate 3-phosphatidyltransferase